MMNMKLPSIDDKIHTLSKETQIYIVGLIDGALIHNGETIKEPTILKKYLQGEFYEKYL